ncbi:SEC23-interacting protein-like [Teleopsis dalmanni]|uniref:SEC23-interacting protein-like n=1 Tax=Teleopsis dalmanni TaxID=139649 RepID=UPI0018CD7CEF|nr:SEC23-interacting protein-like [Teleopsis dalmanni]
MGNQAGADENASTSDASYKPAVIHWFLKRPIGKDNIWTPFSRYDSALLETAYAAKSTEMISVEGGRYDADIQQRKKVPVYWEGDPIEIKRCSWFYKIDNWKIIPFDESIAKRLEAEYEKAVNTGVWHKKISIERGKYVILHKPTLIAYLHQNRIPDPWGGVTQINTTTYEVRRDLKEFQIEDGETERVDQLLFVVHGIGVDSGLTLRTLQEVVDEFRELGQKLIQSHFKTSSNANDMGRVEILPISWHGRLHSEELGIDKRLKAITLESMPKLRNFANETLLDILFYTSPIYGYRIRKVVVESMNRIYEKYCARHPKFNGNISVAGHSLGAVILFDIMCNQIPHAENDNIDASTSSFSIDESQLNFEPHHFFALGSPIGVFLTVRGREKLGLNFQLPTCQNFFNIFHPYDPVAYRMESLVNPKLSAILPVLIPHYKGRMRMHLELKEKMRRVGQDLKSRFMNTFRTTLNNFPLLGAKMRTDFINAMNEEAEQAVTAELQNTPEEEESGNQQNGEIQLKSSNAVMETDTQIELSPSNNDISLGQLNNNNRIDYVLQEGPLEYFNEYIFAINSHVSYWDSRDTVLFILRQIYKNLGHDLDIQISDESMQ